MKRKFLERSPRERLLITIFFFAAGLVWLVSATGRLQSRWRESRAVQQDAVGQQIWLAGKAQIEARAAEAAAHLDPARTLDATRLVGEVSGLASRAGLSAGVEPPRSQRSDEFAYHTVQVSFRRASLGALVKFYRELSLRAPYLALEECAITASRSNPAELDAVFTIFSVEAQR
jgi:hypothetical protein